MLLSFHKSGFIVSLIWSIVSLEKYFPAIHGLAYLQIKYIQMNTLPFFKASPLVIFFSIFLISCGEDPIIPAEVIKPQLDFKAGFGFITENTNLAVGNSFTVNVTGLKGDNPMSTLSIREDGTNVALDRIEIAGITSFGNPISLGLDLKVSFDFKITIKAHTMLTGKTYDFILTDDKGNLTQKSIVITVTGTPVFVLEGILLNQAGSGNTGGLDLDTGASTGATPSNPTSASAEIRDEGIVNDQTDQTWKQQISGMNGSEVKYIIKGTNGISESFTFENVKYKEDVASLWSNGTAFVLKSTDMLRAVSNKVAVGEVFLVKNGAKYYLLKVKNVKVTTNDNKDQYTFDVKL